MPPRIGGRYVKDPKTGKPERVEHTTPHPDGAAPRDARGRRLDRPEPTKTAPPAKAVPPKAAPETKE